MSEDRQTISGLFALLGVVVVIVGLCWLAVQGLT